VSQRQKRTPDSSGDSMPPFEEALARLEQIAQELEHGDLPLEKAIALAEEGLRLSQHCDRQLREAEGKVRQLVERMGAMHVEPLAETDEGADE